MIPLSLLFPLIAVPSIENLLKKKYSNYIFLLSLSLLLFFENFITIDIVSMKLFGTFQWGKYTFIKIGDSAQSRCDGMAYNSQYTHIQFLYQELHRTLMNSPYSIIVNNLENNRSIKGLAQKYEYAPMTEASELAKTVPSGRVYYVFLPWLTNNKDESIARIKKYYNVSDGVTINQNGYWLRYYKLMKATQ